MEFLPSVDPVDGLDEDVLFQVLSYLSRHDLYQWSLVSRNFASIARPLLWRRIEFRYRYMTKSEMMKKGPAKYGYSEDLLMQQIRDDDARGVWNDSRSKWNGTLEQKRFFKLHRSVTQSPEIGAMVQEYILLFRYTSPGVDPLTSDILLFLPNLRFLTVQTSVISYQTVPERKLVLDPSMLGGLSELSLDVSSITFAMVAGYMCLPNIRSLSIRGRIHKPYYGVQDIPGSYKSKCSGLRSLKFEWVLDGYKQKPDPNYARLLELPHSLETLSIKLCKPAPSANLRSAWSTMDIYPGNISALLEPVKSSLKELEVIALGGTTFRHDGTRMDISTFGLLRKVTISSILTVRPSVTDPGCAGLYQLLPVSIQELKIRFHGCSYIGYRFHDQNMVTEDTIDPSEWLMEIAEHKTRQFPGLERVALSEVYQDMGEEIPDSQKYWRRIEHKILISEGLKEVLESNGIVLSLDKAVEERIRGAEENIYKP